MYEYLVFVLFICCLRLFSPLSLMYTHAWIRIFCVLLWCVLFFFFGFEFQKPVILVGNREASESRHQTPAPHPPQEHNF